MTKFDFSALTIPITEIKIFVILHFKRWFYLFRKFIDRVRNLFVKFVAIPYRSGGWKDFFN